MARALILDAEAVHALSRPTERTSLSLRARAIARVAYQKGVPVRIPAAVLAEVSRGPRFDVAINQLLNREAVLVADLTRKIAQRAGSLLERARMGSAHAVDAFVVATALEFDSAVIATGDVRDLERLAAPYRQITLLGL